MENPVENPIVRCSCAETVDPRSLRPHPKNPNKHPAKQLEMLQAVIEFSGWRKPITVSKLTGFVTKGHGVLEAALAAGWTMVPVDYQEYANIEMELADIVADNQLARMSEMETGKLKDLLVELDTGAFDMELTGFEQTKLEKLFTSVGKPPTTPESAGAEGAPVAEGTSSPPPPPQSTDAPQQPSHVRMVQLFLNEETHAELTMIVDHFQKQLGVDNVTDTVLEILRAAYRTTTATKEPEAQESPPEKSYET